MVTLTTFAVSAAPALAASVTGASFSGAAGTYLSPGGTLFARQGAALTLTVNTDSATQCVQVTDGARTWTQTSSPSKSTWLFSGTAYPWGTVGSGSGVMSYTATAFKSFNGHGTCTANQGEKFGVQTASYTLDNTAPTATATLSPAPNGAGWNRSDVTVSWTGQDTGGSGVASVLPSSAVVTADGIVSKTTVVTDNVGNSATSSPVLVQLDKTPPTVTGSRSPAPNANGWNNTPVTVTFTPADATSGVKSFTGPTTLSSDGASQSVTGTATDNADNSASTTVAGINIDTVAPTLAGAPTTSPNAAGWYRGDVTVRWTATDALSGVAATPADTVIGGEGTGLTASTSVTDRAGNSSGTVQSRAVKIDRTAPMTTVSAPPAWNKSDVTLTLSASDNLSGVDATYYRLDGGPQTAGTSVPVSAEGSHTLTFWSTDVAGNTESARTVSFGIDKTSPTIGHTQSPTANADGWNNSDVTVTFTCSDALSGIASCTGPRTVGSQGASQTVTGTAVDNAGNTASDPAQVSIDTTPPVITVDPLPAPNGYGWYGTPVTTTYTASDALSGIKTQDYAHTFGEGAGQTDTASATDVAGNTASVTTPKVNVDTTPPSIAGVVVGSPNAHRWFGGDVTVHWTCSDNLSGVVACPADSVVTGEGTGLAVSASVTDHAGHTSTATVTGINIDRTAPTTTATNVPAGWVNHAVTVGLQAGDALSDVDSTYYEVDGATTAAKGTSVTIGAEGVHSVRYWSVDGAGNVETPQTFGVSIDLSSPTISPTQQPAQNANGWNNTDVTVSFACQDQTALSGLASCTPPATVTTEGKAQSVGGTATDAAGNSTSATATVNIDKTAPTITGAPDRAPNAAGWYRGDVTVSFDAHDGLSGVGSVTGPQHLTEGANQTVSGSATDNAGNTASTSVSGINIDETAPQLSAAPTSEPNADGWYNTPVTEQWAASDGLSGLDGPVPAPSVLSSEGMSQVASASVSDLAGNTTSATSAPVDIDLTAPTTSVSAPDGWVNQSVTLTFNAFDGLSGVAATHFSVDAGPDQTGASVVLTAQGSHDITYYSVDRAGNVEAMKNAVVKIDTTAPTITHTVSPAPNGAGWNNSDVTVTFSCADQPGLSGLASCTAPQTVTSEVTGQPVTGAATDNAGNRTTDTATVSLDRTKPVITGTRSPSANAYGWNNTPVTVHFDATDERSGLAGTSPDSVVTEGANQSVTGTAIDNADNAATATVGPINVDTTAPTLSGTPTTGPNAAEWYRGDVTVHWTAADNLSGLASTPDDSTITGEGSGLTTSATVADLAGNATTSTSPAVNIDRTPPTTGADAPTGWNGSPVTVSLNASDGLSGVAATYSSLDGGSPVAGTSVAIGTEGVHTLRYWSVDRAGNVETAQTATVKIDLTRPTIGHSVSPAPNGHGWNNGPVTVSFGCGDALSGVASCTADTPVATDGTAQTVVGTAVDNAGNTQTDDASVNIDTVKPTISGAPDRPANANGWYAGDVTVTYACADALSGVDSCSAPVTLHQGQDQTATGTAVDNAGNAATATVSGISIDTTAPTLTGAPTTDPNAAGWYNGDVVVHWSASDALSGLDGAAPADSTITGEGAAVSATATVSDRAGNSTTATRTVKLDRTAPTTTVDGVPGWSNNAVTLTLTPSDNLSGVAHTYYQLDAGPVSEGTSVGVTTEGVHTLTVWSVDVAGNEEAHQSIEVRIDKTAPTITHTQSPAPNIRGWNNSDVTVTFSCDDALSGIASCTAPVTKGEGVAQEVDGQAVDRAGNVANDKAVVNVDRTPPTVTGGLSATPNAYGWFSSDVTATFTCADQAALSGILSCPATHRFGEGKDQAVTGVATDAAGNDSTPVTLSGVNVDETAPTLTGQPTTAPNGAGWYRDDVTVHWAASDALSGIDGAAPADSTVTGEGDNLSSSASVSDRAGNTSSTTVGGLKIDRHAPTTLATAPSGWQSHAVTVQLSATDTLSGVAGTYATVDGGPVQTGTAVTVTSEGSHTVAYWSVDKAGNVETAHTTTVLVDTSAPTISGAPTTTPNAAGWYRSPVTVRFACADAVSGVASCQPDVTLAAQGLNSTTGTAVDNAGNTATTTVGGVHIDTVAPTVTIGGVADGAAYTLGAVPTPTVTASDATSGLAAPATGTLTGGLSNGVGTFTYTATATDRAGNTTTVSATYRVYYGYGTTLFLQPVNDTAHQTGVSTSVFNAGQTIPMKFQLRTATGALVQTVSAPAWLTPVKGSPTTAAVNEGAYPTPAGLSSSTYVWDGTQYQLNWKTDKTMAGSYWRVGVALDDGRTYTVSIGLR